MASAEPTPAARSGDSSPSLERFSHSLEEILARLRAAPLHLEEPSLARRWPARHSELLELRAGDRSLLVKRILRSRSASVAARTVEREYGALVALRVALGPLAGTIPEPLAHLPELHALVMSKLPGVTLAAMMRQRANRVAALWSGGALDAAAEATGRWLREFHAATGRGDRPFDPGAFLTRLEPVVERCVRSSSSGSAIGNVAERLRKTADALAGVAEPVAARHGDFIPQNVLLEGGAIGIVDFEGFDTSDAVFVDLASFTAYLDLMRANPLYSRAALAGVRERFLRAYGAAHSTPLALYGLAAALRHAAEVDTSTPRGRRRRQRFDLELEAMSRRLMETTARASA